MSKKHLSRIGIAISASVLFHASAIAACIEIAFIFPKAVASGNASKAIMDATRTVKLSAVKTAKPATEASKPLATKRSAPAQQAQAERPQSPVSHGPAYLGARPVAFQDIAPSVAPEDVTGSPIASGTRADIGTYENTGEAEGWGYGTGNGASSGGAEGGWSSEGEAYGTGASHGPDPATLTGADFKRLFAAALKFPEAARRTGKTGTVGIIASVAADGRIIVVRVSSSSGSAALDAAARNAALSITTVAVPGRPLDLSLRAVFARGATSLEP